MAQQKKRTDPCIFTIDAGTQSIRACLIDLQGNIHDIFKQEIEPYFSLKPGWAEQDPEYYWKTLTTVCRKVMASSSFDISAIKGVTLTTQRNTMINLDRDGKPLRAAITWMDRRQADKENWPPLHTALGLKAVDMYNTVMYAYRECEANWIRQNQPDIWEKTHKFVFLSGFFTHRLTGEYVDSNSNTVGYVPFNSKRAGWADKNDIKWKIFSIDKSKLTDLVDPSALLGHITKKASKETGIPEGLPVIAASTDKACEVLGSGCLTPDIGCLSYGTTATVQTTTKKYVEVIPFIPPYMSAVPGAYNTEVMIYRGFWMVSWFKKEFGLREVQIAAKRKIAPEMLFDELIKDIPPGSMGLMLQPYWSPGVKVPGLEAKGSIIGFGDVHTRAHIYRAILEGLAYALKDGLLKTERKNKVKIEKLRVSGGGSQSRVAMQMTADIFNLPADKPHTNETSALGAAIDAAVGLKLYSDFESAVKGMTRVGDAYEPIKKNAETYKRLFEDVYLKVYDKLQPLYQEIRNITGYPPEI
jgi:sugar (pentulose or hexulose) kinase